MNTDDLKFYRAFLNHYYHCDHNDRIPVGYNKEIPIIVVDFGYCKYELVTNKIVYESDKHEMPPARGLSSIQLEVLHPSWVIRYIDEINNLSDDELKKYIDEIESIERSSIHMYDEYIEKLSSIENIHSRAKQLERKIYGNK